MPTTLTGSTAGLDTTTAPTVVIPADLDTHNSAAVATYAQKLVNYIRHLRENIFWKGINNSLAAVTRITTTGNTPTLEAFNSSTNSGHSAIHAESSGAAPAFRGVSAATHAAHLTNANAEATTYMGNTGAGPALVIEATGASVHVAEFKKPLKLSGASQNPASTTGVLNMLYGIVLPKAWARLNIGGASPTILDGINIAAVSHPNATTLRISLTSYPGSGVIAIAAITKSGGAFDAYKPMVSAYGADYVEFVLTNSAGANQTIQSGGGAEFHVIFMGRHVT